MSVADCETRLCFDFREAAGFHSELMAILAGFAFAGIIFLLNPGRLTRPNAELVERGLTAMMVALITLLISSFLYGTAAGEELLSGRSAFITLLAGVTAVLAVLNLFFGLTCVLRATQFDLAAEAMARLSASGIPVISFLYLIVTALNQVGLRGRIDPMTANVLIAMAAVLMATVLVAQVLWKSPRLAPLLQSHGVRRLEVMLVLISLSLALAAAVSVGIVLRMPATMEAPQFLIAAFIGAVLLVELLAVLLVRQTAKAPSSGAD